MKFTISSTALNNAVKAASGACASNAAVPVLSGLLIHAGDGMLSVQSTDGTSSIRYSTQANVEEPGDTVLSGKVLKDIARGLPDAAVTMSLDGNQATLECGKAKYRLNTMDPSEFPAFPDVDADQSITVQTLVLQALADRACRVASKDQSRPILMGVMLKSVGGTMQMVATDSYRMVVTDTKVEGTDFECIIPATALKDALGMAGDEVAVSANDRQVVISSGRATYVTRRIEGQFPNYRQLMPSSCSTTMRFDADEFSDALKRVSVTAKEVPTVRVTVDPGSMFTQLLCQSPSEGESTDIIAGEVEGDSITIALNWHYLADALASCDGESVMELINPVQPAVIKNYGVVNTYSLLMPVRM